MYLYFSVWSALHPSATALTMAGQYRSITVRSSIVEGSILQLLLESCAPFQGGDYPHAPGGYQACLWRFMQSVDASFPWFKLFPCYPQTITKSCFDL